CEAEPVQPAAADLTAAGVQRQIAIAGDALAALDELAAFAHAAETKAFQPGDRIEAEAVVELRRVHVSRLVVRMLPEIGTCGVSRTPFRLVPAVPLDRARHRGDADRRA